MARPKKVVEETTTNDVSAKQKVLELKNKFNAQFKSNVVQTYDEDDDLSIERLSSGILSLDLILGKGSNGYGWPKGRICEISGPEAGGKSSIVLSTVAEVTKSGGIVAYVDAENALNLEYAESLGVVLDNLLIINPDNAEQGFTMIDTLAKEGTVQLIVLDSIVAMAPSVIMEGDFDRQFMDTGAKLNNQFLRVVSLGLAKHKCTLLIVNQIREKVGFVMGNPEYTPGGRGLKFYSSVRLEVRRKDKVKDETGEECGHIIKAKAIKNKTSRPQQTTEFKLDWGIGFDRSYCIFERATELGVIVKGGAWYTYGEQRWQGKEGLLEELRANEEFYNEIRNKVLELL